MKSLQNASLNWFQFSDFAAALALANLYLLPVWDELQDRLYDYYRDVPYQTWTVFGESVANLLLLACLFWPLIACVRRIHAAIWRKLACALLLAILVIGADEARLHGLHFYGGSVAGLLGKTGALLLAGTLGGALLYLLLRRDQALSGGIRKVLAVLVFLVPVNLASTAWAVHTSWPIEHFKSKQALPIIEPAAKPRFIWVIFDEWDQYLTFQGRTPGLALPEIDRFRSASLHAETVFSPANDTQESLPSLITGRIVQKTQRTSPDELLLTYAGSKESVPWSKQPNIFQRVRRLGVNSALAGYFHPYPRVLGADLVSSSSVSARVLFEQPIYWNGIHGLSKLYRMAQSPLHRVPLIVNTGVLGDWRRRQAHKVAYEEILDHAFRLAERPEAGLVLLHLPVPHPPPIYDRKLAQITAETGKDYSDNLALADLTLGDLRKKMEAAGQWDSAFVLLTSDHPLRGRLKHPWIPFLLKVPGQKEALNYDQPFNSVLTQDLVLAAINGDLHSAQDVARWLDQARLSFPTTAR